MHFYNFGHGGELRLRGSLIIPTGSGGNVTIDADLIRGTTPQQWRDFIINEIPIKVASTCLEWDSIELRRIGNLVCVVISWYGMDMELYCKFGEIEQQLPRCDIESTV